VKKKYSVSPKDKKDWDDFVNKIENVPTKEEDILKENIKPHELPKLDLHGFSLNEANTKVDSFITSYFNKGFKKILIITGKGSRSKAYKNPYLSESLSILKNSVPEYILNNQILMNKVSKIEMADQKSGGDGALYIFFKKNKNL